MTMQTPMIPETQMGPAEHLLDLVLNASAHLWHNRPGLDMHGIWKPANSGQSRKENYVKPGLHVPAAEKLYARLLELFKLNPDLMAHFASYALKHTEWRDLKVAACALMLVQNRFGEAIQDDDGSVAFYDDDYRQIGEAMILFYEKNSTRMLTPKGILRVAELLELPEISALNRKAGFGDPTGNKPLLGRWKSAAQKWLQVRELNLPLLQGLVAAGYKKTIMKIARKVGYKPISENFFALLGWKQSQSKQGHRVIGLDNLKLEKRARFDGLSEAEICETIVRQKLKFKEVVGRLPKATGLTAAIMVALLPSLSNRELRQLTPTLEELGLLNDKEIRQRWETAINEATDQRALNIAKNVRNKEVREKLKQAAEHAVQHAVAEATQEKDVHVMFLIDKSGSMQGAIDKSKQALAGILAGFPQDKVHIATFDTVGNVLRPKATTRKAVDHMLKPIRADGGTLHAAAIRALHREGVSIPAEASLVIIVVGDESGESGREFANAIRQSGYQPHAMALLVNVSWSRGNTVRDCARELTIPFAEVTVDQFEDPYQVPRVLAALLEAPLISGTGSTFALVEKVMKTPLLELAA